MGVSEQRDTSGPLAGVRVVEVGQLLAGPFCGQMLGDLGADVIKVEDPTRGDPLREWGREKPGGKSVWWSIVARNKRSVCIDLRTPEGQQLLWKLVAEADVLVENFRPGTLERWGLGYDKLSEANPRLILARVTGYGQSGPYAQRAGYGSIGEAMGGLRYVVGDPSTPPSRVGVSIGDTLAALFATIGVLASLVERGHTHRGQVIDSAIYESVLAIMESVVPDYEIGGHIRERSGSILPDIAPSNTYPTADGRQAIVAANQDTVFRRLAVAMGRSDLADDPRFATHVSRGANQTELDELIAEWTSTLSWSELEKLCEENGVPAGLMFRAPEMLADPHYSARESIVRIPHPEFGEMSMQNVFPRFSRTPGHVRWVGPSLGEHTIEVLKDAGFAGDDIDVLRQKGVIR